MSECPYCEEDHYLKENEEGMCAKCRDMYLEDEIELGVQHLLEGHTVECASQFYRTAKCICGVI